MLIIPQGRDQSERTPRSQQVPSTYPVRRADSLTPSRTSDRPHNSPIYNPNLIIEGFLFRGWAGAAAALTCAVGVQRVCRGCAGCADCGDVWEPYSATSVRVALKLKLELNCRDAFFDPMYDTLGFSFHFQFLVAIKLIFFAFWADILSAVFELIQLEEEDILHKILE